MKSKLTVLTFALLAGLNISNTATAQGTAFSYQGHLTDNGTPVSGIYDLRFAIYALASGGSAVGGPVTSGTVPSAALANAWSISGNSGTIPGLNFLGTLDDQPLEFRVSNQRALRLEPNATSPNVLGGFPGNIIANGVGAVIAGGGNAGFPNHVSGNYCTVVGGQGNTADGDSSTAMGFRSTAGGNGATAMGREAVAGGIAATAMGESTTAIDHSFAAGTRAKAFNPGCFVWADSQSADFTSTAPNQFLVRAAGGVGINATAPGAMLQVGDASTPDSQGMIRLASHSGTGAATRYWDIGVPEGDENVSGKFYSFVIDDPQLGTQPELVIRWDTGNTGIGTTDPASRLHAVASMGNGVQGDSSDPFASGVYGENNGQGFGGAGRTTGSGTAVFGENPNENGLAGLFIGRAQVNGQLCADNVSCTSDRNAKEHFAPVDPQRVLARVATLPITRWNFKQDADTEHIGPMAQDFYAAFGLGKDDKHIATVDADGVALAAIQGLNQKVEEQLKAKDAEIQALKQRLTDLEKLIAKFSAKEN